MRSVTYSIDTSALMDGWLRYYPPEHFPGLWGRVDSLIDEGRLLASEEVLVEVSEHADSLAGWLRARQSEVIIPTDNTVTVAVRRILAAHERLVMSGSGRNRADPFVIAVARLHGATVVTGEKGGNASRPKIPSVCDDLGVLHTSLIGMIQAEGWVFD